MMHRIVLRIVFLMVGMTAAAAAAPTSQASELSLETEMIELPDGRALKAERGMINVPENRSKTGSRQITISFRRFRSRSETPVAPVFMLAGGPGGSFNEKLDMPAEAWENVPLFLDLFLRTSDVVLVDMRGIYGSNPNLVCTGTPAPVGSLSREEDVRRLLREAAAACRQELQSKGFDITGYNVEEAADDLRDVMTALGYRRMGLYGISFGSHWALATIRRHPDIIRFAILEGVEGPDHSFDLPGDVLAAVKRIARSKLTGTDRPSDEVARLFAKLETRITALARDPVKLGAAASGAGRLVEIGPLSIRRSITSGPGYSLSKRDRSLRWEDAIRALADGDYGGLDRELADTTVTLVGGGDGTAVAVFDCASGGSAERRQAIAADPAKHLLGGNLYYESVCAGMRQEDLGEDFRSAFPITVPLLIVSGSDDVSTPRENAREIARYASDVDFINVMHGSHFALQEALEARPDLADALVEWMRDSSSTSLPGKIVLPPWPSP